MMPKHLRLVSLPRFFFLAGRIAVFQYKALPSRPALGIRGRHRFSFPRARSPALPLRPAFGHCLSVPPILQFPWNRRSGPFFCIPRASYEPPSRDGVSELWRMGLRNKSANSSIRGSMPCCVQQTVISRLQCTSLGFRALGLSQCRMRSSSGVDTHLHSCEMFTIFSLMDTPAVYWLSTKSILTIGLAKADKRAVCKNKQLKPRCTSK